MLGQNPKNIQNSQNIQNSKNIHNTQNDKECRICKDDEQNEMINPCNCRGSLEYIHYNCLKTWIETRGTVDCEVCRSGFKVESRIVVKSFREYLNENRSQKRIGFVIMSLFVVYSVVLVAVRMLELRITKFDLIYKIWGSYPNVLAIFIIIMLLLLPFLICIDGILLILVLAKFLENFILWKNVNHRTVVLNRDR